MGNNDEKTEGRKNVQRMDEYDEDFNTFFEVISPVVKIVVDLTKKKPSLNDPIFFNGEKIRCDGHYAYLNGIKYLKISEGDRSGYVPESALLKL